MYGIFCSQYIELNAFDYFISIEIKTFHRSFCFYNVTVSIRQPADGYFLYRLIVNRVAVDCKSTSRKIRNCIFNRTIYDDCRSISIGDPYVNCLKIDCTLTGIDDPHDKFIGSVFRTCRCRNFKTLVTNST